MGPSNFTSFLFKLTSWLGIVWLSTTIVRFILLSDSNKRVYNHTPGPCRILQGIENGSAGIEYVPELRLAFISNGLGGSDGEIGRILTYEFPEPKAEQDRSVKIHEAIPLKIQKSDSFRQDKFSPLGLSSFTSKGRVSLYVVNTHPERKCVEAFTFVKEKSLLQHRKSICDHKFNSLTDIAVVGADRFFVTNLAYFNNGWMQMAELSMQMNMGSILLFNGKTVEYAEKYSPSPSGIFYDTPRERLIVSSMINEVIQLYSVKRDLSIDHKLDISLLSSPGGLYVEQKSGDIFASFHPVLNSLIFHWLGTNEERKASPSQVLRIRMQNDDVSWVVTEPYANDGATISASNAVAYVNDQLLIGSLFGKCLLCDVDYPTLA
uniref:Paraoxonase n=1 Tax=Pristionchus pacificus TaxID=54126 RepID=A0A8R1U6Z6_PRIPA